jgi:hypothetical protein
MLQGGKAKGRAKGEKKARPGALYKPGLSGSGPVA